LVLYAPALGLVAWLAHRVDPEILPQVSLPLAHWVGLAVLPLVAAVLAMITANVTVRRTLAVRV
jgi:cell division transport system permease protein